MLKNKIMSMFILLLSACGDSTGTIDPIDPTPLPDAATQKPAVLCIEDKDCAASQECAPLDCEGTWHCTDFGAQDASCSPSDHRIDRCACDDGQDSHGSMCVAFAIHPQGNPRIDLDAIGECRDAQ